MKYTIVDLFAGAGGLSLGFSQTKKFKVVLAVEKNLDAQRTYKRNHKNVKILNDVCDLNYKEILSKYKKIDVVIGGPPCQGFSNANRQKNHAISMNNKLIKIYVKSICELNPDVFVMENVGMLKSNVHRFYMEMNEQTTIEKYNIITTDDKIELISGKYFNPFFEVVIKNKSILLENLWDETEYNTLNLLLKNRNNLSKLKKSINLHYKKISEVIEILTSNHRENYIKSRDNDLGISLQKYISKEEGLSELFLSLEYSIMIQKMLRRYLEIVNNNIFVSEIYNKNGLFCSVKSYSVLDYILKVLGNSNSGYYIKNEVLSAVNFGVPQKRMRYIIVGVKNTMKKEFSLPKGTIDKKSYFTVRDAIYDLESIKPNYNVLDDIKGKNTQHLPNAKNQLQLDLFDSDIIYNHIVTKTGETALERFKTLKEGENFHNLALNLKNSTYSNVDRTQNTVYLRLKYDEPSSTVVNVRKSMWIHPTINRAISVREAARLQSFPDSFVFVGSKDSQYQQVGNAVPPILAKAIAEKVIELLK